MPRKVLEEEVVSKPEVELSPPALARLAGICVAAWLVPGCGHLLLGKKGRAAILFASILAMFLLGLALHGEFFKIDSSSYLQRLGFLGELCVGAAMPAAKLFGYSGGNGNVVTSDYGTAYLVAAGMLNVLSIFDAYDIALGRKP